MKNIMTTLELQLTFYDRRWYVPFPVEEKAIVKKIAIFTSSRTHGNPE